MAQRELRPVSDEALAKLKQKMREQRKEIRETLAADLNSSDE